MAKKRTEATEINRLLLLYDKLPPKKFALAEGLIQQAARLRVRLDALWADIQENGEFEMFSQSDKGTPYERERPASKTFTATDKNYQAIIRQLDAMLPPEEAEISDELDAFNAE